ncbi:hypothetical protein AK812_SmicGene17761 [Symbiodinium microadriaticum]|uniref:Uncharacterized protein n=1 Tax=Symbiodinium microadriaticum TaxID=2951 RepID=A0A1Q9DWY4_SYMMI|nr:hypothetical protein AK812_SmicGene17761 [Symbiodinium microadriaticum]
MEPDAEITLPRLVLASALDRRAGCRVAPRAGRYSLLELPLARADECTDPPLSDLMVDACDAEGVVTDYHGRITALVHTLAPSHSGSGTAGRAQEQGPSTGNEAKRSAGSATSLGTPRSGAGVVSRDAAWACIVGNLGVGAFIRGGPSGAVDRQATVSPSGKTGPDDGERIQADAFIENGDGGERADLTCTTHTWNVSQMAWWAVCIREQLHDWACQPCCPSSLNLAERGPTAPAASHQWRLVFEELERRLARSATRLVGHVRDEHASSSIVEQRCPLAVRMLDIFAEVAGGSVRELREKATVGERQRDGGQRGSLAKPSTLFRKWSVHTSSGQGACFPTDMRGRMLKRANMLTCEQSEHVQASAASQRKSMTRYSSSGTMTSVLVGRAVKAASPACVSSRTPETLGPAHCKVFRALVSGGGG